MMKRVRRAGHHRRRRSRTTRVNRDTPRRVNQKLSKIGDGSSGRLLDRILATPQLGHVVPRLQPEVLHRVIRHCGLEDCGQLVALATPDQLARVFDLDLWRPAAPGLDEQFDADRFGTWLEVMVEAGATNAAATLAGLDVHLMAAGFVEHIRVFDSAAVAPFVTLDGDLSPGLALDDSSRCEVGGYVVSAKRSEFWDAVTAALGALSDTQGDYFNQVMRACCRLSNSRPEIDGLDDLLTTNEQSMFEVALDREARRQSHGYVPPTEARAFLQAARRIDIRRGHLPPRDPMTSAYLRSMEAQTAPERVEQSAESPPSVVSAPTQGPPAEAVAAIVDLLHDAGVIPRGPRALLEGAQTSAPRLARVRAHLQLAHDRDPDAYAMSSAELAYLANVIAAGSAIQSRPFVQEEASRAAMAVCNLGLENWPDHWPAGEDRGLSVDLVGAFKVGWTILHEDVCMFVADSLISLLTSAQCADDYVHESLAALRVTLTKHWRAGSPWAARDALDVIAILDTPSWAALLALIDQFPTLHAAVGALLTGATRQVDPSAFEFISENSQIQQVRDFMRLLPDILRS